MVNVEVNSKRGFEVAKKMLDDKRTVLTVSLIDNEAKAKVDFAIPVFLEMPIRELLRDLVKCAASADIDVETIKKVVNFDFDSVEEGAEPPKTKPFLLDWEKELEERMLKVTKNYQSDFYKHDIRRIRQSIENEGEGFVPEYLWRVRENGTGLIIFDDSTKKQDVEDFEAAIDVWGSNNVAYYTGKIGGDIFPVPFPHVKEVLRDLACKFGV